MHPKQGGAIGDLAAGLQPVKEFWTEIGPCAGMPGFCLRCWSDERLQAWTGRSRWIGGGSRQRDNQGCHVSSSGKGGEVRATVLIFYT